LQLLNGEAIAESKALGSALAHLEKFIWLAWLASTAANGPNMRLCPIGGFITSLITWGWSHR